LLYHLRGSNTTTTTTKKKKKKRLTRPPHPDFHLPPPFIQAERCQRPYRSSSDDESSFFPRPGCGCCRSRLRLWLWLGHDCILCTMILIVSTSPNRVKAVVGIIYYAIVGLVNRNGRGVRRSPKDQRSDTDRWTHSYLHLIASTDMSA
jgi:hypothetical protein